MAEVWDLLDADRRGTGRTQERGKPMEEGYYHVVVQSWIRNGRGQYLMTRRHPDKPHPLLWEGTGGSVLSGETSLEGAVREVREELGLALDPCLGRRILSVRKRRHFYDVWIFPAEADVRDLLLQEGEVVAAQWMCEAEIDALFQSGKMVPALEYYREVFKAAEALDF